MRSLIGKNTIVGAYLILHKIIPVDSFVPAGRLRSEVTPPLYQGSEATLQDFSQVDQYGESLIPSTLSHMEMDDRFQEISKKLTSVGTQGMTREERAQRRRALDTLGVPNFLQFISESSTGEEITHLKNKLLYRSQPTILQLNVGLYCNQACSHCHVESSPLRKEETMSTAVAAQCLQLLQNTPSVDTLDLTGGAPELNQQFRLLVTIARQWAKRSRRRLTIIDRCNLTVLLEPDQSDLGDFLKENEVKVVASLPCYGESNVDAQRGRGVFQRSIIALQKLNKAGYASSKHPELELDLVYNPSGAFLPSAQSSLQVDYKRELYHNYGIEFNNLLTITNMPIKRFADHLIKEGKLNEYMELLVNSYNPNTVDGLMCLNTVSVDYTGKLYDCDFNQQLGMNIIGHSDNSTVQHSQSLSVFDVNTLTDLERYAVRTDNHCFGCTAGSGSSCQGATA